MIGGAARTPRLDRGGAAGMAGTVLKALAALCLVAGILGYLGGWFRQREPSPAPAAGSLDGKQQATTACEDAIRNEPLAPFRVISFPSGLVGREKDGYAVSGSVDLQSTTGDLLRKRYFCRVRPDSRGRMIVGEARLL